MTVSPAKKRTNPNGVASPRTCRTCRYWDSEPFATQCDGVTPVVGPPQMGCCLQPEMAGCKRPDTAACKFFLPPIVSVCMICNRTIAPDHLPCSEYIPVGAIVSHGICVVCIPAYCAEQGMSAEDTARILAAARKEAA